MQDVERSYPSMDDFRLFMFEGVLYAVGSDYLGKTYGSGYTVAYNELQRESEWHKIPAVPSGVKVNHKDFAVVPVFDFIFVLWHSPDDGFLKVDAFDKSTFLP